MKKIFALAAILTALALLTGVYTTMKEGTTMINLPALNSLDSSRSMISAFGGYDHRLVVPEGSFYNENNLTSDNYPVLSTRKAHGTYKTASAEVSALSVNGKLCYVAGGRFYVGDTLVTSSLRTTANRQLVNMGAYMILYPEMFYVNTQDLTDRGYCSNTTSSADAGAYEETLFWASDESGKRPGDSKGETPKLGDLALTNNSLERYNGSEWEKIETTYVSISFPGIANGFNVGDAVSISGITSGGDSYTGLNDGIHVITAIGEDLTGAEYITVKYSPKGNLGLDYTTTNVQISRSTPTFDFICEAGNRLWGCRHGLQNGEFVNEIYASKLGDFKNFYYFNGTSIDSYVVSVGSDGPFTGAVTHQGVPLFFKENMLHRVLGNMPSNYQMQTTECRGVQSGSYRSFAVIDDVLFYKALGGIYAYDGSLPQLISEPLGSNSYFDGVGGSCQSKYYINMRDENGIYATFVYDVRKGIWHRGDEGVTVNSFTALGNELYFAVGNKICTMYGSGTKDTANISWYAETGLMGTESPDYKYISRLTLRMALSFGASLIVSVEYDSLPEWIPVATLSGYDLSSFSLPLKVERCDHFRLRFDGVGECRIYSITKTTERGSEA